MIIYATIPFLRRQLTVFKQDDAVVFVSLANDGVQEFLATYPDYTVRVGDIPELAIFERYAAGEPVNFKAIHRRYIRATPFQRAVWEAMHDMSPTETLTYSELAARAQHPTAIRAVASAVGKNPLTIINACHRILPKSGGIGQYEYGPEIKQVLLERDTTRRFGSVATYDVTRTESHPEQ